MAGQEFSLAQDTSSRTPNSPGKIMDFASLLIENPFDWELRLLYADYLDDQGEPVLANGQRFQGAFNRRPQGASSDNGTVRVVWYKGVSNGTADPWSDLEEPVFDEIQSFYHERHLVKVYQTTQIAECELAKALHLLAWTVVYGDEKWKVSVQGGEVILEPTVCGRSKRHFKG